MSAAQEPARVRELEDQIRELQAVHTQLVSYAEDLNRTYVELRLRHQQMTALSAVAPRMVRARTVESCARACVEGASALFPKGAARLYVEDRKGSLRTLAESFPEDLQSFAARFDHAAENKTSGSVDVSSNGHQNTDGLSLVSVGLEARGRIFGVLVIGRQGEAFNEHDAHLVGLLGNSAAVAIEKARLYNETRRLAITDSTTGLYNFRYFRSTFAQEVHKARRLGYPLAIVMADIDLFKAFNDRYGHPAGNLALRAVARALLRSLRQTDTVARYGGEEFAVVLPGCGPAALTAVAEKMRESVARAPIQIAASEETVYVTISLGGAWQDAAEVESGTLLAAADRALYQAKALGRDRAVVWP